MFQAPGVGWHILNLPESETIRIWGWFSWDHHPTTPARCWLLVYSLYLLGTHPVSVGLSCNSAPSWLKPSFLLILLVFSVISSHISYSPIILLWLILDTMQWYFVPFCSNILVDVAHLSAQKWTNGGWLIPPISGKTGDDESRFTSLIQWGRIRLEAYGPIPPHHIHTPRSWARFIIWNKQSNKNL